MKVIHFVVLSSLILAAKSTTSTNTIYSYKLFTPDICSKLNKLISFFTNNKHSVYRFDKPDKSALILRQSLTSSTYKKFPDSCTFAIDASKTSDGFYVNINSLNLRRNETTGECYDYIQISSLDGMEQICDNIGIDHMQQMKSITLNSNKIKILIYIDSRRPFKEADDKLDISIIFTGFQKCHDLLSVFNCVPKDKDSCISQEYYKDGIINCPANYCRDEDSCFNETKSKALDSSNIAISAIASFIFTSAALITCLWVCWKYKDCAKYCISDVNRERRVENPVNIELPTSSDNLRNEASAPPIDEDKDLPPSYESLFLEQKANG